MLYSSDRCRNVFTNLPLIAYRRCKNISDILVSSLRNIRFSSLFAAGDVLRGGTSATKRQKFHTDDVKSVRNLIISADWTSEQLCCSSHCLRMTNISQKAAKVKYKRNEYVKKDQKEEAFEFCWSLFANEHNTLPKSTRRNVKLNIFAFETPCLPNL